MFKTTQYAYLKDREHCGFDANNADCMDITQCQSTLRNTFQTTEGNHIMR